MPSELIHLLNNQLDTTFSESIGDDKLLNDLSLYITDLIDNNFQKLVRLLYQVDIDEQKLKQLLLENEGNETSRLIANLLIERQLQKIKTRDQFRQDQNDDDNEKW